MTGQSVPPPPDLAALKGLEAKATPGPWKAGRADMLSYDGVTGAPFKNIYTDDARGGIHRPTGERLPYEVARGLGDECIENAQFIAALRNAAPWLLARAEEVAEHECEPRLTDAEIDERIARYHDVACGYQRARDAAQAEATRLRAALTAMQNHWQTTYHDDNSQACVDYFYRAIDAALAPPPEGEKQTP